MARSEEFRQVLTDAVHRISAYEADKPIGVVQDELGYALNKNGGSALEWWRQGNLPRTTDVEKLAREIIRRSDLDQTWLSQFLQSANYPHPEALCRELFPTGAGQDATRSLPPAVLPNPAYRVLVGREALLDEILDALQDTHGRWVIAIDGLGGMGKTALAREAAARCEKDRLFERVIWLSAAGQEQLRNGQPGATFESVLDSIARHLAAPGFAALDAAEKRIRMQAILRRRRLLLVLDNLESASAAQAEIIDQLHPLLNPSKALCTSRQRFAGDAYAIHLGGLTAAAALHFIRQEGAERRVRRVAAAPPADLAALIEAASGSPLAMKVAVGQLRHLPLSRVLQTLHTAGTRDAQETDDEMERLRLVFMPSWRLLARTAKALMVALALFVPGEGGGLAALHAVSGLSEGELTAAINALWRLSLLEVAEMSAGAEPVTAATTATLEELRYFLHAICQNFVIWDVCRLEHALSPGVAFVEEQARAARPIADRRSDGDLPFFRQCVERGLNYLSGQIERNAPLPPPERERRLAMHILKYAFLFPEVWPLTSRLLIQLAPKMEQAGHRGDWLPLLAQGVEQSRLLADGRTSAELQLRLGLLYQVLGDYAAAAQQMAASVHEFEQIDAGADQARALNRLAYVERLQRRHPEATRLAESAMQLLAAEEPERGSSHTVLGTVAFDHGDWAAATEHFRRALALWTPTGDKAMIARRLRDLGPALRAQKDYPEAIACYEQAIALFDELQEPVQQAVTRMNLGVVYSLLGQPQQAIALYALAEPVFQRMGDERQLAKLNHNRGLAYDAQRQRESAKAAFLTSIAMGLNIGDAVALLETLAELITVYSTEPQHVADLAALQQAQAFLEQIGAAGVADPRWQAAVRLIHAVIER